MIVWTQDGPRDIPYVVPEEDIVTRLEGRKAMMERYFAENAEPTQAAREYYDRVCACLERERRA